MDIKKVAVLGAGAVGSYVIWGLSARRDIELGVVADGPRGERLVKEGCAINGKVYRPAVWTPQEAHDADLLIVCLKYGALPGALDSIKAVTGPRTTIMSLMNGVDSEDIIASAVGGEHLLYSLIKVASHKEADGVHFDPATTVGIIFGEKEPPCGSPRVKAVEALFGGTELHFRATDCIREEMWSKFRLNVCNNLPQAILGAGVGCYRDSVHMKAISDGLRRELEAIAACTIGGVSTNGGVGTVPGILLGVLVFEVLKICLQYMQVNPAYTYIAQGIVIVVAVALDLRKYLAKK